MTGGPINTAMDRESTLGLALLRNVTTALQETTSFCEYVQREGRYSPTLRFACNG